MDNPLSHNPFYELPDYDLRKELDELAPLIEQVFEFCQAHKIPMIIVAAPAKAGEEVLLHYRLTTRAGLVPNQIWLAKQSAEVGLIETNQNGEN